MTVLFEFNQTSGHGASQSADIALLDGENPVVLVEAKGAGRQLSSDQIDKYLQNNERGLVSDGFHWILCRNRESTRLLVYDGSDVSRRALETLISFIRGHVVSDLAWGIDTVLARTTVKPQRRVKDRKAIRNSNPVVPTISLEQFTAQVDGLPQLSPVQMALLTSILARLQEVGGFRTGMRWEVRSSRISVFDQNIRGQGSSHRVARLLLDGLIPDVLVLNSIVSLHPQLAAIAKPAPHDKHPGMRRFRLGDDEQANQFGIALVDALDDPGKPLPEQGL